MVGPVTLLAPYRVQIVLRIIDHCAINGNRAMMTKPGLCGINAGSYIVFSNVTLNDTQIERNEAFYMAAMAIYHSKVEMNRCNINGNHARGIFHIDGYSGGDDAGIWIDSESEVSMNDVIIEGNIADNYHGAIENAGKLNLNEGMVITRNTAKRYSALYSPGSGIVIKGKGIRMYDNHDDNPNDSICIEGILKSVEF